MNDLPIFNPDNEYDYEINLRPKKLNDFVGQDSVKNELSIYIQAAKMRNESLDHVLLSGPPGLGKTTLASIIASEMNVNFRATSAPILEKGGDLAAILTSLEENDVFFIDEIHRLRPNIEEILYSAIEDFQLDIIIGQGPNARNIKINLPHFTFVGATTKAGALTAPLHARFGILMNLNFYSIENLAQVIKRSAVLLGIKINEKSCTKIARCARGTPRIANRLLKRIRDYAMIKGDGLINVSITMAALEMLNIDKLGLDSFMRRMMTTMIQKYDGGPVGLETIAASISEDSQTIEDVYEPYLLQLGFLKRTSRGRQITSLAYQHLGLESLLKKNHSESELFD